MNDASAELSEFVYLEGEKEILLDKTPLTKLTLIFANAPTSLAFRWLVPRDTPLLSLTKSWTRDLGMPSPAWFCRTNDRTLLKMSEAVVSSPREVADFVGVDPARMDLVIAPLSDGDKITPALPFDRAPLNADVFKVRPRECFLGRLQ